MTTALSAGAARAELLSLLAHIQATELGSRWPRGVEYRLWRQARAGTTETGRRLHRLALAAGCWWVWSEPDARMVAVPLDDWLILAAEAAS